MNDINIKELEYNLKGIDLSFESINDLINLYKNIKDSRFILVPSPVIKTVNIALEGIHRRNKLKGYETISLENNEDSTIFDKILATIKAIWKKIVETWDYIWDKILEFFTGSSNNAKTIEDDLKKKEERVKRLEKMIELNSIARDVIDTPSFKNPLDYLDKELADRDILDLVDVKLFSIDKTLLSNLKELQKVFKLTEDKIKSNSISDSKNVTEIDIELYNVFFKPLIQHISILSNTNAPIEENDVKIIESLLPYQNITIDKFKSRTIDGFIKGGCIYFYLIENNEDRNMGTFECLAIDKRNIENSNTILYFLEFNSFKQFLSSLKLHSVTYGKFIDQYNDIYKDIKKSHLSIKKEIDKFINNSSVIYEEDPDNFRAKFEILRNISHSMLRYALELSKGVGMYQDTFNYYNKLSNLHVKYYENYDSMKKIMSN